MDKYKFLNAINSTDYLDKVAIQQLNELVESYPYFQTAYLLLAQKVVQETPATTELTHQMLPSIAAHIGDREVLYKIWNPTEYALKQGAFSDEAYAQIDSTHNPLKSPVLYPDTLHEEEHTEEELITKGEPIEHLTQPAATDAPPLDQLLESIRDEEETENIVQDLLQKSEAELDDIVDKGTAALPPLHLPTVTTTPVVTTKLPNSDEDSLLSTGEISEQARQQVEAELHRRLNQPNDEQTTDTANLTNLITQEVRQIMEQDIQKDLQTLEEQRRNDLSVETEQINKSIEKPAELDNIAAKLQQHQIMQGIDTTPPPAEEEDRKLDVADIDADLLSSLQHKLTAYTSSNDTPFAYDNDLSAAAGDDDVYGSATDKESIDYSEKSESVESLLDEFEAYKRKKQKFSTVPDHSAADDAATHHDHDHLMAATLDSDAQQQQATDEVAAADNSHHETSSSNDMGEVWQAEPQSDAAANSETELTNNALTTTVAPPEEADHDLLADLVADKQHDGDDEPATVVPRTTATRHAELSVSREGVVLSEMMAKVYARQGHYPKAIQIYEQLCAEYPEKSAYFAAKINELNNKQT